MSLPSDASAHAGGLLVDRVAADTALLSTFATVLDSFPLACPAHEFPPSSFSASAPGLSESPHPASRTLEAASASLIAPQAALELLAEVESRAAGGGTAAEGTGCSGPPAAFLSEPGVKVVLLKATELLQRCDTDCRCSAAAWRVGIKVLRLFVECPGGAQAFLAAGLLPLTYELLRGTRPDSADCWTRVCSNIADHFGGQILLLWVALAQSAEGATALLAMLPDLLLLLVQCANSGELHETFPSRDERRTSAFSWYSDPRGPPFQAALLLGELVRQTCVLRRPRTETEALANALQVALAHAAAKARPGPGGALVELLRRICLGCEPEAAARQLQPLVQRKLLCYLYELVDSRNLLALPEPDCWGAAATAASIATLLRAVLLDNGNDDGCCAASAAIAQLAAVPAPAGYDPDRPRLKLLGLLLRDMQTSVATYLDLAGVVVPGMPDRAAAWREKPASGSAPRHWDAVANASVVVYALLDAVGSCMQLEVELEQLASAAAHADAAAAADAHAAADADAHAAAVQVHAGSGSGAEAAAAHASGLVSKRTAGLQMLRFARDKIEPACAALLLHLLRRPALLAGRERAAKASASVFVPLPVRGGGSAAAAAATVQPCAAAGKLLPLPLPAMVLPEQAIGFYALRQRVAALKLPTLPLLPLADLSLFGTAGSESMSTPDYTNAQQLRYTAARGLAWLSESESAASRYPPDCVPAPAFELCRWVAPSCEAVAMDAALLRVGHPKSRIAEPAAGAADVPAMARGLGFPGWLDSDSERHEWEDAAALTAATAALLCSCTSARRVTELFSPRALWAFRNNFPDAAAARGAGSSQLLLLASLDSSPRAVASCPFESEPSLRPTFSFPSRSAAACALESVINGVIWHRRRHAVLARCALGMGMGMGMGTRPGGAAAGAAASPVTSTGSSTTHGGAVRGLAAATLPAGRGE